MFLFFAAPSAAAAADRPHCLERRPAATVPWRMTELACARYCDLVPQATKERKRSTRNSVRLRRERVGCRPRHTFSAGRIGSREGVSWVDFHRVPTRSAPLVITASPRSNGPFILYVFLGLYKQTVLRAPVVEIFPRGFFTTLRIPYFIIKFRSGFLPYFVFPVH